MTEVEMYRKSLLLRKLAEDGEWREERKPSLVRSAVPLVLGGVAGGLLGHNIVANTAGKNYVNKIRKAALDASGSIAEGKDAGKTFKYMTDEAKKYIIKHRLGVALGSASGIGAVALSRARKKKRERENRNRG